MQFNWQPYRSAPKDGSILLVITMGGAHVTVQWHDNQWILLGSFCIDCGTVAELPRLKFWVHAPPRPDVEYLRE